MKRGMQPSVFLFVLVGKLCLTPYDPVARQAPSSMGFPRQEYWSGLPSPPPGDHPNPGIEPASPVLVQFSSVAQSCPTALVGRLFTIEPLGKCLFVAQFGFLQRRTGSCVLVNLTGKAETLLWTPECCHTKMPAVF